MNRQVEIKAEQIARMIVKGMTGSKIAVELGMSYDGLQRILRQPDYLLIEERVKKQVLGKMDARLEKRAEMSDDVEDAVPEALGVLLENVRKKRDLKAALELLDRDPQRQFAKSNARPVASTQLPLGAASGLASDELAKAIADADVTHTVLQQAKSTVKPAEA